MISAKKSFLLVILALLGPYASATLASPAVRSEGVTVAQAQPDKPVDCRNNPKDPRCEKQ